mmetsp:Transcript_342/g.351  ORF Transcript_342/g.351 Transcript_342/m.351 type:complete len:88 (+) Transcript_342:2230-2493(+)
MNVNFVTRRQVADNATLQHCKLVYSLKVCVVGIGILQGLCMALHGTSDFAILPESVQDFVRLFTSVLSVTVSHVRMWIILSQQIQSM